MSGLPAIDLDAAKRALTGEARALGFNALGVTAIDFDFERPQEAAVLAEMRSFRERVLARA